MNQYRYTPANAVALGIAAEPLQVARANKLVLINRPFRLEQGEIHPGVRLCPKPTSFPHPHAVNWKANEPHGDGGWEAEVVRKREKEEEIK